PTAGPDKMCGDCSRALRRAREGSAALRNLPGSGVQHERAAQPPLELPPLNPVAAQKRGWRRAIAWCAIGLVGVGAISLAMRSPERARASEPTPIESAAVKPSTDSVEPDAPPADVAAEPYNAAAKAAETLSVAPAASAPAALKV